MNFPFLVEGKYYMDTDELGWCLYLSEKYYCDSITSVEIAFNHYINEQHSLKVIIDYNDIQKGISLQLGRYDDSPEIICTLSKR
jgi:hypothetical protein